MIISRVGLDWLRIFLSVTCIGFCVANAKADPTIITLAPTTGPTEGQPSITSITLTGSNYPSGTINPSQVQIGLNPTAGTGSTTSFSPSAIKTLVGTTRRLTFTIPAAISLTSPTLYSVTVSGQTAAGISFSSGNSSSLTIDPPAQISGVVPNAASAGQSLSVTITGQYTNFTQGSTVASFGAGISVGGAAAGTPGPVSVISQGTAVAQISIDRSASTRARSVTVQTGVQTATAAGLFTIAASAPPSIQSVTPASARQGQQNISVSVAGHNTHFAQGSTTANFGAGITVSNISINSATTLSAKLTIDPAASGGPRTVTVTTGTEVAALASGFTVTINHAPVISSLPPMSPVWENLPSVGGPPAGRDLGSNPNVYDDVNDRLIFFSGDWSPEPPKRDVWVLANASGRNGTPTWIETTPAIPGAAGREFASLTYVKDSNRLIVCGGTNGPSDCWVLTNANGLGGESTWIRLPDMPGATNGSGVYDPTTRRLLMFGFVNSSTSVFLTLSDADGIGTPTWSQPAVIGVPPIARYTHAVAYDPGTNRLILFGGMNRPHPETPNNLNDLWILTNANGQGGTPQWIQLHPPGILPAGREAAGFSYDPQTNQAVLFGGAALKVFNGDGNDAGNDAFSDLWLLNNANGIGSPQWTQLNPLGRKPLGHFYMALGRDRIHQILPMALGRWETSSQYASALLFADNWRLNLSTIAAAVGSAFNYTVSASDPDGDNLAFSLTKKPAGMTISQTGVISFTPTATQLGNQPVTVRVDDGNGLSATQSFSILVVPAEETSSPTVTSVLPNVGQIGTSEDITVSSLNAHFVSGQTSAMFDSLTLAPQPYASGVTVLNANTAVVHLRIPANVPVGTWNFNIGDGFELARAANAFTTQAAPLTPVISSVVPSVGIQGQQNLSVSLTGIDTHFAQGNTLANFGAGVNVASISVASPTSATAVLNININATPGTRNVSLTTGTEIATLPAGFAVTPAPLNVTAGPAQTIMLPGPLNLTGSVSGPAGDKITTAWSQISGPATATFSNAAILAPTVTFLPFSDPGIYIFRLTATDGVRAGSADVKINVTFCATGKELGARIANASQGVAVKLSDGRVRFYGSPYNSVRGPLLSYISTDGTTWTQEPGIRIPAGSTASIYPASVVPSSDGGLRLYYMAHNGDYVWRIYSARSMDGLNWTVDPGVRISDGGAENCPYVEWPDVVRLPNGHLRMYYGCGASAILSATSTDGLSWTQDTGIRLSATNPQTSIGYPLLQALPNGDSRLYYVNLAIPSSGPSVDSTYSALSNDGLHWTNELGIRLSHGASGAADSQQAVGGTFVPLVDGTFRLYYNGGDSNSNQSLLSAHWCSVGATNPPSVVAGVDQTITLPVDTVALRGMESDDKPAGTPILYRWSLSSGPAAVTFSNTTSLNGSVQFTKPGRYRLRLSAFDTQLYGYDDLTVSVLSPTSPALLMVTPNSGTLGSTNLSVTVTGQATHFAGASTRADFGAGVTVTSLSVSSTSQLTAQISIAPNAVLGTHTVAVMTGAEVVTLPDSFAVTDSIDLPFLSAVSPNSALVGQQNLSIAVTGLNTNFKAGMTVANFGAGIRVGALTIKSPTSATAVINVDMTAALGARDVIFTTGSQIANAPSAFSVVASSPSIISVSPNFGTQGQQSLSLALQGRGTHFLQGGTTASLGAGIAVTSLTVSSPTSATLVLKIDSATPVGKHDVTMTTGSEVASAPEAFSVTAGTPPVFTSKPPSGPAWINLAANGAVPDGRDVAGSSPQVYDETNDRLIFFSGDRGNPGAIPADVWVLANASGASGTPTWIQLHPQPGPVGRQSHSLAYLAKSNQLVVCGGGSHQGVSADLKDCWILTNANGLGGTPVWSQLPDMLIARGNHSAVYDPASNRLIVFGGEENGAPSLSDTIILENADGTATPAWMTPNVVGALPTGRVQHAAFYDSANNRMVVVGGLYTDTYTTLNDVWALDTANAVGADPHWTQLSPGGATLTARSAESLVYDQTRNQALVFGGFSQNKPLATNTLSDLWLLSCANGIGCTPQWNLQAPLGGPPIPRALHAAGISTARRLMPMTFGRYETATGGYANLSDTWVLNAEAIAPVIGQPFTYQVTAHDPRGESLVFSLVTAPLGMTINSGTGLLNFTPSTHLGNQAVSIKIQNTDGLNAIQSFNLVVVPTGAGSATITSVVPNVGQAGTTLDVTVTGQKSHFLSGQTNVTFSNGLSGSQNITPLVDSVRVVDLTTLVARVTIQAGSASGPVNVTVATPFETSTAVNAFAVQTAVASPSIVSVAPNSSAQGTSGSVTILGEYTHFVQGTTTANFGAGVAVASLTVNSATTATAILNIDMAAPLGSRDVTLTTGSEVAFASGAFSVSAALPSITTVSPNFGPQGLSGPVGIMGQNTHFAQGVTTLDFGAGVTVSNISVGCPTCLTATLSISATATVGARTITATTGSEVASLVNGFTVTPNSTLPHLTSIVPAKGQQGQTLTVAITGQVTHFTQGTTQVSFGAGVTTNAVSVASTTALTAQITIDPAASVGLRTVIVTTGTEVASVANVFSIQAARPILYSLAPGQGPQGQQNFPVVITGLSTHFAQGTTLASFGAGITVVSLTVTSPTSATALLNIAATAALGTRTVTMTTGAETASFPNGFTILAGASPIVYQVNPGGSQQGAQSLSVVITGQNTHFAQGTSVASFGSGITVTSLTVSSLTSATAVINIDPTAIVGPRTVSVTTGSESASFAGAFTVTPGTPGITMINPGGGAQGQQNLSLSVTSQFTNWVQGTTQANFGAGVTLASLTITSPTTATAVVNVSGTATLGPRNVTFTTGTKVVTAPGGFIVTAGAPLLLSVSPNSGQQGQQNLSVTLTGQNTHFVQGNTQVFFGANIAMKSVTVNSAASTTAVISIDPSAVLGPRQVSVQTGSEVVSLKTGFTVTSPPASLISVNPNVGQPGDRNLIVLITGLNTHFDSSSVIGFGEGVLVVGTTVASPTSVTALLDIDSNASIGSRTLTVVTNNEIASLANGFNIVAGQIDLKLDHFVLTAGTSAIFTDVAIDRNGHPLSEVPACSIMPDGASAVGLAPILSGETITTDQTTRGVYTLTCSLKSLQVSASAAFAVLPPTLTTVSTTQQANFSAFSSATSTAASLLEQIYAALSTGSPASVNGALAHLESLMNTVDSEALSRSIAFAPEGGFPADLKQLPSFGIDAAPQDADVSSYLDNLISTLQSLTLFLQTNPLATLTPTQQSTYNQLQTALSMLVLQLPNLNPSAYAVVANTDKEDFIFSNVLPEYFKSLTAATTQYLIANGFTASLNRGLIRAVAHRDTLGITDGPWPSREFYLIKASTRRSSSPRAPGIAFQIGSLLEIELASEIQMNYINQLYGGYFTYLERTAATLSANGALQTWKGAETLDGIISGASLSIFEFYSGDTVIEADNLNAIPENNTVFLIGPDQTEGVSSAIDYIRKLHKPKDSDDAYSEIQGFKDLFVKAQGLYNEAKQPPDDTGDFCLLGNSPPCMQLLYNGGFHSVYQRTRPVQLPAPVLIFVMNGPAGVWSSGVFNFEAAVTQ